MRDRPVGGFGSVLLELVSDLPDSFGLGVALSGAISRQTAHPRFTYPRFCANIQAESDRPVDIVVAPETAAIKTEKRK